MNMTELMLGLQTIITAFQHPIFLSFCILLMFSLIFGIKRLFLE